MSSFDFTWEGEEILLRGRRALGRGLLGIGMAIATEGKRNADVITGTMMRSIHVAENNYTGGNDQEVAAGGNEVPNLEHATYLGYDAAMEVGSWVNYACVEETGRNHQFMQPAVEAVQGPRAEALMVRAFADEGLT